MKNIRCVEMDCNEFVAHVLGLIDKNSDKDFDVEFYSTYNESTEEYEDAYKLRKTSFVDSRILLCNSYGGGGYVSCEYDPSVCDEPEALIKETLEDYWFRMVFDTVYVELTEENQNLCHKEPVKSFVATVEIEKEYIEKLNSLLGLENLNILEFDADDARENGCLEDDVADYECQKRIAEELGAKTDDFYPMFEATFSNGYTLSADVSSNDKRYYDNYFLKDENGAEIEEFYGKHWISNRMEFSFDGVTYVVKLNIVETAV